MWVLWLGTTWRNRTSVGLYLLKFLFAQIEPHMGGWVSCGHLKLNTSKTEFLISPSESSFTSSLKILMGMSMDHHPFIFFKPEIWKLSLIPTPPFHFLPPIYQKVLPLNKQWFLPLSLSISNVTTAVRIATICLPGLLTWPLNWCPALLWFSSTLSSPSSPILESFLLFLKYNPNSWHWPAKPLMIQSLPTSPALKWSLCFCHIGLCSS